jgi:hypothetical protein
LIFPPIYGQINGEWYSFRTKGFTRFSISDSFVIITGKVDSIGQVGNVFPDTFSIVKKVRNRDMIFLIVNNIEGKYDVHKLAYDHLCQCLKLYYPGMKDSGLATQEDYVTQIRADTSRELFLRFYKDNVIHQFMQYRNISGASRDEFISVLDTMYKEYKYFKDKKQAGLFPPGLIALIRGTIESHAFIANHFSPVVTHEQYLSDRKKYRTDEEVEHKIEALESGK